MTRGEEAWAAGNDGVVGFDADCESSGVRVTDRVEGRSVVVGADEEPSFSPSDPESFVFPVDSAVTYYAGEFSLSHVGNTAVLDESGTHVSTVGPGEIELPRGTYYFAVNTTPMLYVRAFDASFTAVSCDHPGSGIDVEVSFDGRTRLEIGARSRHDQPAATITVPDDPEAAMTAVSYLGSGVKEWTVERSWPTIRGHPPAIERGERLHVPDGLSKPQTGVSVSVPREYAAVYRVAPLARYFGATVEPAEGAETTLHLENGYSESLGVGREVEAAVDELVSRCLFLDSLVRIGGYYDLDRYEYDAVAPSLAFYPPELYDASLCEQLMEYFEVPVENVEPYVSRGAMTAVLRDDPADVELLPFLANTLTRVHVAEGECGGTQDRDATAGGAPAPVRARSASPAVGEGALCRAGFEHGFAASPGRRSETAFSVVDAPGAFDALVEVAGSHGSVTDAFDPSGIEHATVDAVRDALETADACVVVGAPATESGVVCFDGELAFADVNVRATSVLFADAAGVTPASRVVDAGAVHALSVDGGERAVGRVAGYLSAGYTLAAAVQLADLDESWWAAGDPGQIVVAEGRESRLHIAVRSRNANEHVLSITHLPGGNSQLGATGTLASPALTQLVGTTVTDDLPVSTDRVVELARDPDVALTLNGDRIHSGQRVDSAFVRESARRASTDEEDRPSHERSP